MRGLAMALLICVSGITEVGGCETAPSGGGAEVKAAPASPAATSPESAPAPGGEAATSERADLRRIRAELERQRDELRAQAQRLEQAERQLVDARRQLERERQPMAGPGRGVMGEMREAPPGQRGGPDARPGDDDDDARDVRRPRRPDIQGPDRPQVDRMRPMGGDGPPPPPPQGPGQDQARRRGPQPQPPQPSQPDGGEMLQHMAMLQQISAQLENPRAAAMMAVHMAREHLTPEQRVKTLAPILHELDGPPGVRNAIYMVLIDSMREMGHEGDMQELLQKMITENAKAAQRHDHPEPH